MVKDYCGGQKKKSQTLVLVQSQGIICSLLYPLVCGTNDYESSVGKTIMFCIPLMRWSRESVINT